MVAKYRLTAFSDEALLVNLERCVGSENEITALVLAHLFIGPISKKRRPPKISAICYVALRFRSSP